MKKFLSFLTISLFLFGSQLDAQITETHEFGETGYQYFVYADGRTWEFTAENNMTVESIETRSILAAYAPGGTFHIEVSIKGNQVAGWDQYVNSTTFSDYFHTKSVSIPLHVGDLIQYKIWGGSFSDPVGAIAAGNYVKLSGGGGAAYDLQFSSLSDLNEARYALGYTADESYAYAVCGGLETHPIKSTKIERYNFSTSTWSEFVSGLIPKKYCSAEYVSGLDKIYVFNGETYSGSSYTDTVEIIAAGTGSISYSVTNPNPVEYGGSAVWNDKIYIFGGSNLGGYSNRLYEFDPATNYWTQLADMPEAKQANGEIVDGELYVFGGYNGSPSNRIDAYNIQNGTWSSLGTMPVAVSAHAVTKSGTLIWIVGSYDNINLIAVYDTESNEFTQLSSNMTGRRHCGAVVNDSKLYVYGGNQGSTGGTTLSSLEVADISSYIFAIDENSDGSVITRYNYPNPFAHSTNIGFTLSKSAHTNVTVYDQSGQQVKTLFDGYLISGDHKLQFNGSDLAGGYTFIPSVQGSIRVQGRCCSLSKSSPADKPFGNYGLWVMNYGLKVNSHSYSYSLFLCSLFKGYHSSSSTFTFGTIYSLSEAAKSSMA